jgi:hypothetical protein
MDKLLSSQTSRVAASSSSSASASSSTTAATSFSSLDSRSSQRKQSVEIPELFNDPFTGVPSTPPDVAQLLLLLSCEYRPCCLSIPASLFFLYFCAPPWKEHRRQFKKAIPQGQRRFLLNCAESKKLTTYQRLYTEWLFSGCAPTSLARLHRHDDGSTGVSFSPRVRACIYIIRLYQQRGYPFGRACDQVASIFDDGEFSIDVNEESWQNVVLRTEPAEVPSLVWINAYPTPALPESSLPPSPKGPTTVVQTEPFRGVASLQPSQPSDVPDGWTLWTPVTSPELQQSARRRVYKNQHLQSLKSVSSLVANPSHQRHIYNAVIAEHKEKAGKKIDFFTPDAIAGAEEDVELGTMSDEIDIAHNPRIQFVKKVSQARQTNTPVTGRPRKSSTPAPGKPPIKPIRLRLIAPRRPSTPEQVAAFEETLQSATHNDKLTQHDVQMAESPPATNLSSEARYLIVMAEIEKKKEEYRNAGLDPDVIGSPHMAGESSLFNLLDWE